jgi:hypothetical protein
MKPINLQIVALLALMLLVYPTYGTVFNITDIQDTYVLNQFGQIAINRSGEVKTMVGFQPSLFGLLKTVQRSYYSFEVSCVSNLTCAIMHLYAPAPELYTHMCGNIDLVQMLDVNASTSWHVNLISWVYQPCGTDLDSNGDCNETSFNQRNLTYCLHGDTIWDITEAYRNMCEAGTRFQVQIMMKAHNETSGIEWGMEFGSVEGENYWGAGTKPYVEVFDNQTCGYTAGQLNTIATKATTTILVTPSNESVFYPLIYPISVQLGLSMEFASLLMLVLSAIIMGLYASSMAGSHKYQAFVVVAFLLLTFYTIMGWFYVWLYILILIIGGLLLSKTI